MDDAKTKVIREALRFANWAAGEGLCPVAGENARGPEDFLFEYSSETGDEDWDTLADRLATPAQPAASDVPRDVVRAEATVRRFAEKQLAQNIQWALDPRYLITLCDALAPSTSTEDWRDDPSADDRWNAGVDFAQTQLCAVLKVDPNSITWDGGTETLDGDVQSAICKVLTAWAGDNWMDRPSSTEEPLDYRDANDVVLMGLARDEAEARAEALRAENARLRAACSRLDAYWLETFPEGPDGDVTYAKGLGRLADECIDLWRDIRTALSR